MQEHRTLTLLLLAAATFVSPGCQRRGKVMEVRDVEGRVPSADGVEIAYSARGKGDVALVLIHGGLADRGFWAPQMNAFADRYRVVALDLGGHGESGRGREEWTISSFAEDVRAVVDALSLGRVVLIGNSLGGPVGLEAAPLLGGRTLGVVGIDTFHDVTETFDAEQARARAEAFRRNFVETCDAMVASLFHPDCDPELLAWAKERMGATAPEVVVGLMEGLAGYDQARAVRGAGVPVRAVNGDLWPTEVEKNRAVAPGFDVKIIAKAGHYPMLEQPAEFNRRLLEVVGDLEKEAKRSGDRAQG
jgi:pimeloyl-ACP methyl ester carboxylesterase